MRIDKLTKDKKNRILIWHSKYGRRYFEASTKESLTRAALKVFKEMDSMTYYWDIDEGVTRLEEVIKELEATIKACPEGAPLAYQKVAQKAELDLTRARIDLKDVEAGHARLKEARGGNAESALTLLLSRTGHEYERVEFEVLE